MWFRNSLLAATLIASPVLAQSDQEQNLTVVKRIKQEAFDHSKVMQILAALTDRYGPRLTASPEFEEAAHWAESSLKQYGISNVHEEAWGPFGRAWSLESYSLEMTAPRFSHLITIPLAWSAPTKGESTAEAMYAPFAVSNRYDLTAQKDALAKYRATWKGKLKGRIVLTTEPQRIHPSTTPLFQRDNAEALSKIAEAPDPTSRRANMTVDDIKVPTDPEEIGNYLATLPPELLDQWFDKYQDLMAERSAFYREEGVAAVVQSDRRAINGLIFAEQAGSPKAGALPPPTYVVPEEQYSRIVRLLEDKQTVSLRFNLRARVSDKNLDAFNVLGEIEGSKRPDEVVMIGAHFDSWHSGTGATDNGAGSAVMLEVMRILKSANLPLARTVRIGLWSGEEQGLYGSQAYVKQHFADPKTMQLKPEHAKLDAYLNLDNGSGKIRGVYLQGNDAARPLFEQWMRPFADMGVQTITLKNTGGTDHLSFDAVGLPGFQFIQDPLDYGTVTHHSDLDTYSHVVPEDLMQAAAVIANTVYQIANQDSMFPRKPLPAAPPPTPKSTD